MTNQHPITPPPELVLQWRKAWGEGGDEVPAFLLSDYIATQAARWGFKQCMELDAAWLEAKLQKARDEELEACVEWLRRENAGGYWANHLLAGRRPKPPSLKQQALADLDTLVGRGRSSDTIRRALELLPDDPA